MAPALLDRDCRARVREPAGEPTRVADWCEDLRAGGPVFVEETFHLDQRHRGAARVLGGLSRRDARRRLDGLLLGAHELGSATSPTR